MRIAVVNTHDVHGGAARAAYRLHQGLRNIGAASTYFVQRKTVTDDTIQAYVPDPSPAAERTRAGRRMAWTAAYDGYAATRSPDIELFSPAVWDDDPNILLQRPRADVINAHWISRFIDLPRLFDPNTVRTPIVWTLHDMNPFTGGCHYDQGCGRYRDACGHCPLLGSQVEDDLSRTIFAEKAAALKSWPENMLHIVTPSRWLLKEALGGALLSRFSGSHIPNGIDTTLFKPVADKSAARAALGWPADRHVVLFVANHIKLARKGFTDLVRALSLVPDPGRVMLVGIGDSHILDIAAPFQIELVKFVRDEAEMARIYAAADVTAIPSKQDNLPNTILESLAAGTPIVAYATGGVPDVIVDGEAGFLARTGNVGELALAFSKAFERPDGLRAMGRNGRSLIERHYGIEHQARAYLKLFDNVVAQAA